ncbi:family 10 glycosylhydrolase [Candidatus Sumerlaeota bacterium]|nr:family 10 glycosylhydrolase [Candidatus Sumerlaeota bacterium]
MKSCIIIFFIVIVSIPVLADDPPEHRAMYAATFDINTQAKCDTVIADALSGNINAVFVEVRGRGDAYYFPNREDSTYPNNEPRGQIYSISPSGLDPLQYCIDRLHNASPRREVHAWVTVYPTWHSSTPPSSPNHVYNAHPEWVTENQAGVTYTYANEAPLDPGIPAVQDYLYNVFMDIVRNYDIDGVHFDYVRLLNADSGYDPVAKASFKADTGFDFDVDNPSGELDEVYKAWKRDQLAKLVQRVNFQTSLEKPWVEVSAFIIHFTDPVENLGQGYNWWVAHGAIDLLHLSAYSSSVSGCETNWNAYIDKLAQNNDQNTRPLVCALGDWLLEDPNENATAVTTLRGNTRSPDGFNFFDWGSLYVDGTSRTPAEPADQHAQNLFNSGGPMDDWAPIPSIPHKSGEETTPPNSPASLSVTTISGIPHITFNRPAAAGDGDLPVHYRLYRDTVTPVKLYYDNMAMDWWDLSSSRSSFSFDDYSAPPGSVYYAAVAYDDWNNQAIATGGPVTASGGIYIIETRSGGQHITDYSEVSGTFFDSSSHSLAEGCTPSIGSRWSRPSDGKNDKARFTPSGIATGTYNVYVTCYNYSSANAPNITVRINDNGGISTSLFDLTMANCGNKWTQCATMNFTASQGHYIEFDSATQSTSGTDDRMNPAAVRFVRLSSAPKEPKSPVSEPASSITEVIVDSEPTSLDYDDKGAWATSTYSPSGTLYGGSSRYYASGSYPMDDYAVWVVDLPATGKWAIDGWIRNEQASLARGVQYRFVDGSDVIRNVAATLQTGSGGWTVNVDGVIDNNAYDFNKGRTYVTINGNTTGSEMILADALRFRLLGTPTPTPTSTPTPTPTPTPTQTPTGLLDWELY